jgi:hypothetical protein
MFRTIASRIQRDNDYPERHFTLDVYGRVLEGAFYDHLPYGFHIEQNGAGEYVPLRDRRPNVRYNLCRLVVDDAVSLLFSEGHFPTPDLGDAEDAAKQAVLDLIKGSKLNDLLLEGATIGAAGSVAFQMRVLKQSDNTTNLIFFSAHATGFLTAQDHRALQGPRRRAEGGRLRHRAETPALAVLVPARMGRHLRDVVRPPPAHRRVEGAASADRQRPEQDPGARPRLLPVGVGEEPAGEAEADRHRPRSCARLERC